MISAQQADYRKGTTNGKADDFTPPPAVVCDAGHLSVEGPENIFLIFNDDTNHRTASLNVSAYEIQTEPLVVWDNKVENRFSNLAEREAMGKISRRELSELNQLSAMRRQLKHPRSGEEVIREYEQRTLTRSLVEALTKYVKFHAIPNHQKPVSETKVH